MEYITQLYLTEKCAFFALSIGRVSLSAGSPEKIHPSVFLRVFLRHPPSFLLRRRRRPSAFLPLSHKKTHSPRCRCEYREKTAFQETASPGSPSIDHDHLIPDTLRAIFYVVLRQVLYSAKNPMPGTCLCMFGLFPPRCRPHTRGVYASHPVRRPEIDTVSGCGFARHRRRPVAVTTRRWWSWWRVGGKKPLYARAIFRRNDWLRLTANSDQPPHTPDASFADAFFPYRRRRRRRSTVRSSRPPYTAVAVHGYRRRRRHPNRFPVVVISSSVSDVLPELLKRPSIV